jgi:tetratricopeptide (TPR) repeat protein
LRNIDTGIVGILVIVSAIFSALRCEATEYSIGPFSLLQPLTNQSRADYTCVPLSEFDNTVSCNPNRKAATVSSSISGILVDTSSSLILYVYEKSSRTDTLVRVEQSVLPEISGSLGSSTARRFSIDNAVALVWGDVKLEAVSPNATEYDQYNPSEGPIDRQLGLLVNVIGDFKAAKDTGRPLYRVIGGDGLIVVLCEPTPRHVVVQRLIVSAGVLSEKKFMSQARDSLARDQNAPASDESKWPEMAFSVRRLALDTTEKNANRVVDEFFSSSPSQKYRSHVWAYLPTSVIKHLRDRTYLAVDIFGEETDFPQIREQIVAQLKGSQAEPYSEFLLYTLGRFDEALQFSKNSPIHTVLEYASAHSKLRQLMATLFRSIATRADPEMLSFAMKPKSFLEDLNPENVQFQSPDLILRYKKAMKEKEENDARELKRNDKSESELNAALANRDFFHDHAYEYIPTDVDIYRDNEFTLSQYLNYFNQFPERYNSRPLVDKYPDFAVLTEQLVLQFDEVLKDQRSPHYDDAAYFSGWLQYHRGNLPEALERFELAIALAPKVGAQSADVGAGSADHIDYDWPAVRQTGRILRTLPPEDALNRVRSSNILSSQPRLWYIALDALYISHNYQMVMDGARLALHEFGVTIEDLPITTDPKRIDDAFTKLKMADQGDLKEIVYLYNASREAQLLKSMLSNVDKLSPQLVAITVKTMVIKYALTKDSDLKAQSTAKGIRPRNKDLRQGIYLAQQSLDLVPKTPVFLKLREWLHYKRITLLAQFDPVKVSAANAEFQEEFPKSPVLDDGMAEQIFGEAVIIGDMAKATATFNDLLQKFPTGNAVDNAYSWMAIGWTCSGQPVKARAINQDIVRLFPATRHAGYSRQRLKEPHRCSDMQTLFDWDYNAMNWRQRTRIDVIQYALAARQH